MKVCFVAGTLGQGGAERQLVFMLQALVRRGISTKVFCLTSGEYFEQAIKDLGVGIEFVGAERGRLRRLSRLILKLRHERPDVLQSAHFYTNLYAGLCGRLLRIPSIGAIRSDFVSEVAAHGHLGRWQITTPQLLVVNSTAAYSKALDSGVSRTRIEMVRNVVASTPVNGNGKSAEPLTILFVGRLDDNKRPEMFLKLAHELTRSDTRIGLRFLIAGDGPRGRELRDLCAKLDLPREKLSFLGSVADMNSLYRQSHILVSTSRREGSPNVILEAMSHGIPVVATRVGGTAEILKDGRGVLVDPEDEAELAESVVRLIDRPDLRFEVGLAGRNYVERHHSVEYLEKRLPEIYKRLIQDGRSH